jgi:uncharacterized repeat protein (TIGR03803 family)
MFRYRSWLASLFDKTHFGAFLVLVLAIAPSMRAQTFSVLHTFSGSGDGAGPLHGLTMDRAGNLYGTAEYGGVGSGYNGYGTVYKLAHSGGGWVLDPLYAFPEFGPTGNQPRAGVVFGPDGALYGTTVFGGYGGCIGGCGVVYKLQPPLSHPTSPLQPWVNTSLYMFQEYNDAIAPEDPVTFDQAGNMYGTGFTPGAIWTMQRSGHSWQESVLHFCYFNNPPNCFQIVAPVTLDSAGNVYGVALGGGDTGWGAIFELSYVNGYWTYQTLYSFQDDGYTGYGPIGGLVFDSAGNLWGTTTGGGSGNGGTIFELTPSNGSWMYHVVYSFTGTEGPHAKLTQDAAGSFYGTTYSDGAYGYGNVFKLSPSNGGWTYTSLYDFSGGTDGTYARCQLVLDGNGILFGCADGGAQGWGVIFALTPQ